MEKFFKLLLIGIIVDWALPGPVNAQNTSTQHLNHVPIINGVVVEMLRKCYVDVRSVVIHGDSDESTIKSIHNGKSHTVIVFNDSSTIKHRIVPRLETNLFLMTPDSKIQFQKMLITFKNSGWWNIMTSYFILDKSNSGCDNAAVILRAAWKMNLLKSFFICVDSHYVPMVYTYNPYTNRAPRPWKQVPSISKQSNGWTMYARPHHVGDICQGLDFDRTKYLDGSIIRVVVNLPEDKHWIPDKDYNESLIAEMSPFDAEVAKVLKSSWNVTLVFNVDEEGYNVSKKPHGFFKRLQNGSSDVAFCLRSRQMVYNFTTTYPALRSKYHIFTNNRGFYTPWEKVKNFYGLVTLVSMIIILMMVFIVVILSGKKLRWSFAGFEVLRLIVNAAVLNRINTLSLRIFYFVIFLYFLIIHATFQGHLSAFLTKDQYRSNVESLDDLRDARYHKIHIGPPLKPYITDPVLKEKLIIGYYDTIPKIIGNESAACIADVLTSVEQVFKYKLHMSKRPIANSLYTFVVRDDWPLKERFDIFFMQLEYSQLAHEWYNIYIGKVIERQKRIAAMSEVDIRSISLPMLELPFIIFAVGIALATVSLAFELRFRVVSTRRVQNRRARPRIKLV